MSSISFIMNLGRYLINQTSLNCSRIISRDFNKRTQKFDYKKLVKMNKQSHKQANKKPRLSLILREDVPNLGSVGQMVQVKRGYGRNHLILNRLAVYATEENKEKYFVIADEQLTKGTTVADPNILSFFENACLEIAVRPGMDAWEITQHHIAVECRKEFNIVVPAHCVEISNAITSYGDYIVDIIINQGVTTKLKCSIVPHVQSSKGKM